MIQEGYLSIYKSNLDKLGTLKPDICEEIVRNANAVRACIVQINEIANLMYNTTERAPNDAIITIDFCIKTTKDAKKSLENTLKKLEKSHRFIQ